MTTASVDLDLLNELFDNQKKLDDLFSFDDDSFLKSMSFGNNALGNSEQKDNQNIVDIPSNEDLSFNSDDIIFSQKKRSITSFVIPVAVEIAVISYAIMYFS